MNYGNQQGYGSQQGYPQGPPPKKGMGAGTVVLIVFGCLFSGCVGLCAVGAAGASKTTAAAEQRQQPAADTHAATRVAAAAPAPVARAFTKVSAAQLIADYEGNEVRGDNAWKNRDVEVTGVVKSIDKGPFGGLSVVLADPGKRLSFHTVYVNLKDTETSGAAALNKGETATFKGRVQGFIVGSVSVDDAEIE